jgi:hypothetical protein
VVRAGSELGLTRMDLAFLLGTAFTETGRGPKRSATLCHFAIGLLIAFGYAAVFVVVGRSTWWLGRDRRRDPCALRVDRPGQRPAARRASHAWERLTRRPTRSR